MPAPYPLIPRRRWLTGTLALLVARTAAAAPGPIAVSPEAQRRIGRKIWQNECGGTKEGLTSWNTGEDFASLGIGHFIWYPSGIRQTFEESFPGLVRHLTDSGVQVPRWLAQARHCPWPDRTSFLAARGDARLRELRDLLADTIDHQTAYIILRLRAALPKMSAAAPRKERPLVEARFAAVASSPQGLYALIDYVNFKGEGVNPKERYNDQGWGLLQVLQEMEGQPQGPAAAREFAAAAKRTLDRRIRNAPRDESRWRRGWFNRCDTYGQPL